MFQMWLSHIKGILQILISYKQSFRQRRFLNHQHYGKQSFFCKVSHLPLWPVDHFLHFRCVMLVCESISFTLKHQSNPSAQNRFSQDLINIIMFFSWSSSQQKKLDVSIIWVLINILSGFWFLRLHLKWHYTSTTEKWMTFKIYQLYGIGKIEKTITGISKLILFFQIIKSVTFLFIQTDRQ